MNTEEIARIVGDQRTYFKTHATFDVDARRRALVSLRDAVRAHEADIAHALKTDLGKSHDEAYMCEIGTSLSEIRHQIAHVARWSRPRLRPCDLANAVSACKTQAVPYGVTLIMAPWNYPFLLTLEPLAAPLPRAIPWSSSRVPMLRHRARCSSKSVKRHLIRAW